MNDDPLFFDFSADELLAVGDIFGHAAFPGVDPETFAEHSAAEREAALGTASRALVARGVVRPVAEDTVEFLEPFDALFSVVLAPGVLVQAASFGPSGRQGRLFHVCPELAVEQSLVDPLIHRLTPFESTELLARLIAFVELRPDAAGAEDIEFVATAGDILAAEERGDGSALPREAAPFVAAISNGVSSFHVSCLHKTDGVLSGGELTWYDAGDHGLWLVERAPGAEPDEAEPERVRVRVRGVGSGWLVDELLDYLPGGGARVPDQPAAT